MLLNECVLISRIYPRPSKRKMASILQHQVESKVNDLYFKMQKHAQIIMKLSVELDNVKQENEELRNMINQDRRFIKGIYEGRDLNNDSNSDIKTSQRGGIMKDYQNYNEVESQDSNQANEIHS